MKNGLIIAAVLFVLFIMNLARWGRTQRGAGSGSDIVSFLITVVLLGSLIAVGTGLLWGNYFWEEWLIWR